MDQMSTLLGGKSGVYRIPPGIEAVEVERAVQQRGFRYIHLDGHHTTNRQELFRLARSSFELPAHFGNNWDALLDMLRDLSWLPASGYVVLVNHLELLAVHDRASYDKLLGVLHDATVFWAERMHDQPPMMVLLADLGASDSGSR